MGMSFDEWTTDAEELAHATSEATQQYLAALRHLGLAHAISRIESFHAKVNELKATQIYQGKQITELQGKLIKMQTSLESARKAYKALRDKQVE